MNIAVIAAMAEELQPLRQQVDSYARFSRGKCIIEECIYQGQPLLLVECGIGKVNAAIATTILMQQYQPDLIINIGSAGAMAPELKIGDVVIGSEFVYADVDVSCFGYAKGQLPKMPAKFSATENAIYMVQPLVEHNQLPFTVKFGQILSSDAFVAEPELKQQRAKDFPDGLAVEMESAAIAHVASCYGVDLLAFRAISDLANAQADTDFSSNLAIAANSATSFLELLLTELLD